MGLYVADLLAFYSDLMKLVQKSEEARRCFLASFDMIFTRICEIQPHAADFSQTCFCLDFDEIRIFVETMFPCDAGYF